VHAHWLAGGLVAALAGRPFVVTLHGSISAGRLDDFSLARRAPRLVGLVLRRARTVVCVSQALADAARRAGARRVVVVPNGVEIPAETKPEGDPPEVLFAGRLSREKGIEELVAAADGMNLVVAGDGPLRRLVPSGLGLVPHDELQRLYDRAAVVACPSHSEGFGMVCAEAMAHGRPVVAGAVGGLLDMVVDGETGLLVPPGDVRALRAALQRLLADPELRRRLGASARAHITALCGWDAVTDRTIAVYEEALA
jgi:glycosyltransferase involved in cell wall biosynthesis